jgi:hypothetical protein
MKTKWSNYIAVAIGAFLLTSCGTTPEQEKIDDAAKALSKVEDSTDKWGKIAVSELNMIENSGQFKTTFDLDVSNYVSSAQNSVSGAASADAETGFYLGVAAQASVAPPVNPSLPGSGGSVSSSNAIPNNASTALNNFSSSNPALNIRSLTPTADLGESVRKGLNDKIAEQLLKLMMNPPTNSNQKVVWAVMQVTCQPQSETKQGYIGEFNATFHYARKVTATNQPDELYEALNGEPPETNKQENVKSAGTNNYVYGGGANAPTTTTNGTVSAQARVEGSTGGSNQAPDIGWYNSRENYEINNSDLPSIFAVLPMVDSQMEELRNSSRNVLELAAALSAAFTAQGLGGSAQILSDYVNRQQDDVDTRTTMPTVTAYTDGASFGVQIYPSLQALKQPGKKQSSSGQVLQPVSFPVVVALLVSDNDLKSGGKNWDQIWTQVRSRWIPVSGSGTYTIQNQISRARNLDEAVNEIHLLLNRTNQSNNGDNWNQMIELIAARDAIQSSAMSYCYVRPLPDFLPKKDTTPKVSSISPHAVWRDRETTFAGQVDNLTQVSQVVIAGNIATLGANMPITSFNTNIVKTTNFVGTIPNIVTNITATTNVLTVTNGVFFTCTLPQGTFSSMTEATNSLEFTVIEINSAKMATTTIPVTVLGAKNSAAMKISRDANGKVTGISINSSTNMTDQNLIDSARDILKASESPPSQIYK